MKQSNEPATKEPDMRDPNPPPSFVVGGYPPGPCTKLLSLRLRDTPDTRRLLEQLKDLPDVLARGGSMTVFVAGEWVGNRDPNPEKCPTCDGYMGFGRVCPDCGSGPGKTPVQP